MLLAWSPYIFLVIFVLILNGDQIAIPKPYRFSLAHVDAGRFEGVPEPCQQHVWMAGIGRSGLSHSSCGEGGFSVRRQIHLQSVDASGTAALFAVFASAIVLRVSPRRLAHWTWVTMKQLALPTLTIVSVLGLAYLMNYSGATGTLGLMFAATGAVVPLLQRDAGLGRRVPDRQRHVRQRAVRKFASGDGEQAWASIRR